MKVQYLYLRVIRTETESETVNRYDLNTAASETFGEPVGHRKYGLARCHGVA